MQDGVAINPKLGTIYLSTVLVGYCIPTISPLKKTHDTFKRSTLLSSLLKQVLRSYWCLILDGFGHQLAIVDQSGYASKTSKLLACSCWCCSHFIEVFNFAAVWGRGFWQTEDSLNAVTGLGAVCLTSGLFVVITGRQMYVEDMNDFQSFWM